MDNLPLHHLVVIVCSETSKTVSYHSRFWGKLLLRLQAVLYWAKQSRLVPDIPTHDTWLSSRIIC